MHRVLGCVSACVGVPMGAWVLYAWVRLCVGGCAHGCMGTVCLGASLRGWVCPWVHGYCMLGCVSAWVGVHVCSCVPCICVCATLAHMLMRTYGVHMCLLCCALHHVNVRTYVSCPYISKHASSHCTYLHVHRVRCSVLTIHVRCTYSTCSCMYAFSHMYMRVRTYTIGMSTHAVHPACSWPGLILTFKGVRPDQLAY